MTMGVYVKVNVPIAVVGLALSSLLFLPVARACPGSCGTTEDPDRVEIECSSGCVETYMGEDALGVRFTQWRPQVFCLGTAYAAWRRMWIERLDYKIRLTLAAESGETIYSEASSVYCDVPDEPDEPIGCNQVCHIVNLCLSVICPEPDEGLDPVCGLLPPSPTEPYKPSVFDQAVIKFAPPESYWDIWGRTSIYAYVDSEARQDIYIDEVTAPVATFCWGQTLSFGVECTEFGWVVDWAIPLFDEMGAGSCSGLDFCKGG